MGGIKKIVLVIPSLHAGGMERVMSELATFFSMNKKTEVHLILLTIQEKFYHLPEDVFIHEPSFEFNKKRPLLNIIKTMWFLRKKIYSINPATVLSFGEMYNSFVLIATIFSPFNIYVSDRSKPNKNWGHLQHFLRFLSYKRATGIISQTNFAKEIMFSRLSHRNIKVIGNPIKPLKCDDAIQRENIILTVGRLIPSKRIDLLIQLFNQTSNNNWQLHIMGDGPEREKLERLVVSLNLQHKVIFLGTKKEIEPYYAQGKIFAFTSNSEGFPNVLGEAMSAGLAPITFDFIAGASDLIINNENGFLIEMDNEAEYVRKLNALMQDEELINRLSKKALESIKKFDTAFIAEEYFNFIVS